MSNSPEKVTINCGLFLEREGKFICSCGHSEYRKVKWFDACSECGAIEVKSYKYGRKSMRITNILDVVSKDDRSFHISKREVIATLTPESTVSLSYGHHFELLWSLRDKSLKLLKNGKSSSTTRFNNFFSGITHEQVLNVISTENNKTLLGLAYDKLGKRGNERTKHLDRALLRLPEYPALEILNFAGFSESIKEFWDNYRWRESKETKPSDIIGVPKYLLKYLRKLKRIGDYTISSFRGFDKRYGGNTFKIVLEVLDDESDISQISYFDSQYHELVKDYGYTNHRKLITYLARDIKLHQGISSPSDGASTLRDYLNMCKAMGINPEKYPKNLKKSHDIAMMNYKMMNDEKKNARFKEEMDNPLWDTLTYTNKKFTVIKPTDPKDLIDEGDSLGHCVASYVDDVIKGKCKIVFVREVGNEHSGLLTVELRGEKKEDLRIVQVRGRGNRNPIKVEADFVKEWAEKKELKVRVNNI